MLYIIVNNIPSNPTTIVDHPIIRSSVKIAYIPNKSEIKPSKKCKKNRLIIEIIRPNKQIHCL